MLVNFKAIKKIQQSKTKQIKDEKLFIL